MQAAAVIPVYNRAELLSRLLATLSAQTVPFNRIVVVDNGSTDGAAELAESAGCHVIRLGSNLGFAHAVNLGWRECTEPWVAILNSDVELDTRWLESLLQSAGSSGFATGAIFDARTREVIDGTYDLVSRAGCAWRAGHGQTLTTPLAQPVSIKAAPGTACLYRRTVLESLGGYDESYGSYMEDVDLGLRCAERGISGLFVPEARAWHHGSATLGRWHPEVVRLISRNQLRLLEKHYDPALIRAWLWPIILGQLLWGLVAAKHGAFAAWLRGKAEGLRSFHAQGHPTPELRQFLLASESEIRERSTDSYWRWYFRLGGAAR